tara:strand:- start:140 stop:793 length:654 start_codon:yes stop_codon:yes gene_type:complete
MQINVATTNNVGFIEGKLDKIHVDYLWKIIEEGKKNNLSYKSELAGHLSNSFKIEDTNNWFFKNVLDKLISAFYNYNEGSHPKNLTVLSSDNNFVIRLEQFWANYQYKHEFNPPHNHSGLYAFVIWMKIPYTSEEQKKLKFLDGLNDADKKAGDFEFLYTNLLGDITTKLIPMSPELEGTIILFPAQFMHCVYPFYDCDEPRISLSGNLMISSSPAN